MTSCAETRVVFEDVLRLGVAKKLPEKTQLADWLVGNACVEVGRLDIFVDDAPLVAIVEYPAYLTFVVLARIQTPLFRCLDQSFIRACIGQRVGQGIARVAWRHHSPTVLVRLALSELVAIGKLSAQHKRLNKLRDCLLPIKFGGVQFELLDVFSQLRIRRIALEDFCI